MIEDADSFGEKSLVRFYPESEMFPFKATKTVFHQLVSLVVARETSWSRACDCGLVQSPGLGSVGCAVTEKLRDLRNRSCL